MIMEDIFGEPIYSYSRANALEDGVLVDAGPMAKEAGIKYPVALTRTLWERIVTPHPSLVGFGQSESGRLWDVLWMFHNAARRFSGSELCFQLYVLEPAEPEPKQRLVTLKAVCGPGDDAAPVITIMMPDED